MSALHKMKKLHLLIVPIECLSIRDRERVLVEWSRLPPPLCGSSGGD